MTSIGTLFAFMLVCAGVWILRVRRPDLQRGFTVPALPLVAIMGIVVCGSMIYGLGWTNWLRLLVWLVIGLVFYFGYGKTPQPARRRHPRRLRGATPPCLTAMSGDRRFWAQGPVVRRRPACRRRRRRHARLHGDRGWSAWDAFYMAVITITTVGYREVHDLSSAGQVFTVFCCSAASARPSTSSPCSRRVVVEGGLPQRLQKRRQARMLDTIKDHFIVCGYGRIGSIVARQFQQQNVPFVVIERDPARLQAAMMDGLLAVQADASHEDVLKRVGIDTARGLIAAVGTDAENVYTVLSARVLRPDLFIVGRAETRTRAAS